MTDALRSGGGQPCNQQESKMPVYDYQCPHCGPFEAVRKMAEYKEPNACPWCSSPAPRIASSPQLNTMSGSQRKAHATNEQSAHMPRVSRGCCAGNTCSNHSKTSSNNKANSAPKAPEKPRLKMQTGVRRPWQISH